MNKAPREPRADAVAPAMTTGQVAESKEGDSVAAGVGASQAAKGIQALGAAAGAEREADAVACGAADAAPHADPRELYPEELAGIMADMAEPAYRGGQVFAWLHKEAAPSYDQMTNLSAALRHRLEATLPIARPTLLRRRVSTDGTIKYLFALADGARIESVLMRHREDTGHIRHTACLSSQAGCAMGCAFCATASLGFKRNLSAGEIVAQVLEIATIEQTAIHNAVYMGMGEPLLNGKAVEKSIRLLHHPQGQNIGARRITLSTCGLPEGIRDMATWGLDLVLAVSLHAADDDTRSRLMPVNRRHPLGEVLAACRDYSEATGKRITFEYAMIKGVNIGADTPRKLVDLLNGIPCNINLIPVNPGAHGYKPPNQKERALFLRALQAAGLDAVVRQERGQDIQGACGQLAGEE